MIVFIWVEIADQREQPLWPLETRVGPYAGLITAHLADQYWTVRKNDELIAIGFCINRELARYAIEQIIMERIGLDLSGR